MVHSTPEELKSVEQKVEDARNVLSYIEQDHMRYTKLIEAQKYDMAEKQKEREELNQYVDKLAETKNSLLSDISTLTMTHASVSESITSAQDELTHVKSLVSRSASRHQAVTLALSNYEDSLTAKEEVLALKEKKIELSEKLAEDKHAKIKNFIETL